jgi:hypothetical protein
MSIALKIKYIDAKLLMSFPPSVRAISIATVILLHKDIQGSNGASAQVTLEE